jgi:hypothetical protein
MQDKWHWPFQGPSKMWGVGSVKSGESLNVEQTDHQVQTPNGSHGQTEFSPLNQIPRYPMSPDSGAI